MKADKKRRAISVAAGLVLALAAIDGSARPGGGQSFSGRSSSSSSSGSYRSGSSSSSSSGGFRSGSSTTSSSGSFRSGSSTTSSSSGSSRSSSWGGSTTSTSGSFTSTSSSGVGGSTSGVDGPSGYSGSSSGSSSDDGPRDRSVLKVFGVVFGIIIAIVALSIIISRRREAERRAWEARAMEEAFAGKKREERHASIEAALAAIKSTDDAFSYVLFEDFLYALYAEVHEARGKKDGLERLQPYLSEDAMKAYESLPKNDVEAVVIGGMRVDSIEAKEGDETITVLVNFTSNVSEKDDKGAPHAFYMEELWTLERKANTKSRPPEKARVIGCPSCGAPLDKMLAGQCGYCDVSPTRGEQDWFVANILVGHREERGPMLTGTTQEVGTDLPTIVAPDVKAKLKALEEKDPAFKWASFIARVERTFHTFHRAWSAQDLKDVRPYLSDNLFELQRYWVQAYKSQKLRNTTKDATIVTVHLAKVVRDRFFDSITVRVFARCFDYTVDETGKVVGGSPDDVREYSEYWTFIRGVGKTGAPRSDGNCPSCGAPLSNVNMAGTCTSCNAKITSGEFDWVLSRIEQDEVYEAAA